MAAIAGKVMMRPRGPYSNADIYEILDLVSHNDKAWICKRPNTVGVEPSETNDDTWQLLIDAAVADASTLRGNPPSYFATASSLTEVENTVASVEETLANTNTTITNLEEEIGEVSTNLSTNISEVENSLNTKISETNTRLANVSPSSIGASPSQHEHSASNISSGTLSTDRLPVIPVSKGGFGGTTPAAALTALGITASAAELNHTDGVTSNIQTQFNNIMEQVNGKAPSAHSQSASTITAGTLAGQVNANASSAANVGMAQVRNIYAGTADMTAGVTPLETGALYFVYE